MQKVNGVCIKQGEKCAEAVAGVLLIGLHDMAFRDAIREDSRQTTPSRGVTPRKKFAVEAVKDMLRAASRYARCHSERLTHRQVFGGLQEIIDGSRVRA